MLREIIEKYSSLSIIGMCKNAGKTTVLNRIVFDMQSAHRTLALTSIGRDGESVDVVTSTHKPGIYVFEGTLVATAESMLKYCDITREIVMTTGVNTPLGEVAVVRALSDGSVQLAGPSITAQLVSLRHDFEALGADMVIIDGAISRKSLSAPSVSDATILCTGASYDRDINTVVEDTAYAARMLMLKKQTRWSDGAIRNAKAKLMLMHGSDETESTDEPLSEVLRKKDNSDVCAVYVNGAVTEAMMKPLLMSGTDIRNVEFTVTDGSKLLIGRATYEKLSMLGAYITVNEATELAAITVNPVSAYGFDFDRNEFAEKMTSRAGVPVLDVGRQL